MFWTMSVGGAIGFIVCVYATLAAKNKELKYTITGGVVFAMIFVGAFFTASGELVVRKICAGSQHGNWIIIDNSGGATMRHWILTDAFAESSDQSDGWQFYDDTGENLCYVSGDAFVARIGIQMDIFLAQYKKVLNIPPEQEPVNWDMDILEKKQE